MAKILIIDDDEVTRLVLKKIAEFLHHEAAEAKLLAEGLALIEKDPFDLVFLDVMMPDGNGLDVLPLLKEKIPQPEVIIITGLGNAEGAELAIRSGAWDYLQKPFSRHEITLQIIRALEFRAKKAGIAKTSLKRDAVIGISPEITFCLDQVAQCAMSNSNVLLTGETGTGKELIARTIHENSQRAGHPFVVLDCAALPDTLVESILFGHKKGAFTGAEKDRIGLIRHADGGTLFLDEIGELQLSIQRRFLRVLQERSFRPVGSSRELASDFRLISATNKNLPQMVQADTFRNDLFFRIKTFQIEIPPLRKRTVDIQQLTQYYLYRICAALKIPVKGFTPELLEILQAYHWPGNVRELINTLEKTVLSDQANPTLYPMHLPKEIRIRFAQAGLASRKPSPPADAEPQGDPTSLLNLTRKLDANPTLKDFKERVVQEAESGYLIHLMDITQKNIKQACEISGLSLSRLYTLLRKYRIPSK